MKSFKESWT